MERTVARFVARLRRAGLPVSPSETLDAVRALAAGGLESRARARALLRLTLVKSRDELEPFDRLFEAFFGGSAAEPGRRAGPASPDAVVDAAGRARPAAGHGEEGERSGAAVAVEDEVTDAAELDLGALDPAEGESGEGLTLAVQARRHPGGRAREPRRLSYTEGPIYLRTDDDFLARWRNDGVKPFPPEEEAAMEEVVARMVKRLAKDARRLRRREPRGRLDVAKTLRRNARHGMVPFVPVLRRRRRERPRLVVLCDVSYSVSHASRFLLLLVHTLQRGLLDVRSFVFNRELAELTDLLRRLPLHDTLELVGSGAVVGLEDESDFGAAFAAFADAHLASLRGRPAVIVLGDARNNHHEARAELLDRIRERASTLLWLTPEERDSWELGDCLMGVYGPRCDRVEVVRNVEALSRVVEELVRGSFGDRAGGEEAERPAPAHRERRRAWQHGGVAVRP